MTVPVALAVIPEAWAAKARCPLCEAVPLQVQHVSGQADQFHCGRCGSAFEVEQGGARIHLVEAPRPLRAQLQGRWLTASEARAVIQQMMPRSAPPAQAAAVKAEIKADKPAAPPAFTIEPTEEALAQLPEVHVPERLVIAAPVVAPPAPPPVVEVEKPMSTEQVVSWAERLHRLGNKPEQIEKILTGRQGVTAEQVAAGMAAVKKLRRQGGSRTRRLLIVVGVFLGLCVLCGGVAYLRSQQFLQQLQAGGPIPLGPEGKQITLPSEMRAVMQTPVVVAGKPDMNVPATCPRTPQAAAQTFGGRVEDWEFNSVVNGWQFVGEPPAATVRVSNRLLATFMVVERGGVQMRQVRGPATISNVSGLVILCP